MFHNHSHFIFGIPNIPDLQGKQTATSEVCEVSCVRILFITYYKFTQSLRYSLFHISKLFIVNK